jgi:signal transduction histidine kinase
MARDAMASGQTRRVSGFELRDSSRARLYDVEVTTDLYPASRGAIAVITLWPDTQGTTTRALEATVMKLAESRGILTAVLDNTNNGIFLIGPDLTVLYANRRVAELFDLDLSRIIGRNQRELLTGSIARHATDPRAFVDRLTFLYQHFEETAVDEVELANPGHRVLERYSGPVYQNDGSLLGRIELYTDVTEVRELQRNKDDFLSLVSHELRTPVTSIKGYAQLLKRRAKRDQLPEQAMLAAETIERQTARMQELIDLLLDLTRLDTGRLRLEKSDLDLVELVRRVAGLVQITTEAHTISVEAPAAPIWVHADEHRLEQVVTNLVHNAVRYSPEGGPIEVSVHADSDGVTLSVRDRGIGIPPDALDRIFERFYRAPDVVQSTGLGIGLYITRAIVEHHGGSIRVESELGSGSTFVVTLPA